MLHIPDTIEQRLSKLFSNEAIQACSWFAWYIFFLSSAEIDNFVSTKFKELVKSDMDIEE